MSKQILDIFGGNDVTDIIALIDRLEKSSFDYLRLEGDGIKLVIGKNGVEEEAVVTCHSVAPAQIQTTAPATTAIPVSGVIPALTALPVETAIASPVAIVDQVGVVVIKSPSYGLFYAQPEPGAPSYVEMGGVVKQGDTLGLVEIMKTFTAITSSVAGKVVGVHVKNEQMLEPDQPLFSIQTE